MLFLPASLAFLPVLSPPPALLSSPSTVLPALFFRPPLPRSFPSCPCPLPLFFLSCHHSARSQTGARVSLNPFSFPSLSSAPRSAPSPVLPQIQPCPFLRCDAHLEEGSSGDTVPDPQIVNVTVEILCPRAHPGRVWRDNSEKDGLSWSPSGLTEDMGQHSEVSGC